MLYTLHQSLEVLVQSKSLETLLVYLSNLIQIAEIDRPDIPVETSLYSAAVRLWLTV